MKLEIATSPDGLTLRLEGALDIYSVEAARQAMLDHLAGQASLRLDLAGIQTCDAAGMQLLLAARRSALAAGKAFLVAAEAASIKNCTDALGIAPGAWRTEKA